MDADSDMARELAGVHTVNTLAWLEKKYSLNLKRHRMPVPIPNAGRNDLAAWCRELGFTRIVEVGVRTGRYTQTLCASNPQAHVYGVDPWTPYEGYLWGGRHNTQAFMDAEYAEARERLKLYRCTLVRAFSQDAVRELDFMDIDMVYIDANHAREYVLADIEAWSVLVRPGGIVAGHDYKQMTAPHERVEVFEAVNEYTARHAIRPWFVIGSRRSIPSETRDHPRSWMWIKD